MEYYNNILTVEAGWMIENGLISKSNFDKLNQRGDLNVVRRGCRNTPALVAFDSMPDRYKKAVTAIVGDVRQAARQNAIAVRIEHSPKATEFFDRYMVDDDRHLPTDKRREYYTNSIVLDAIGRLISERNSKRRALGSRATRFWDEIAQTVQELDKSIFPHTLPANARSLERKYQRYMESGYESLIHKAYTNGCKNAAKVADENQEAMLVTLMSDPRNLDNAQVSRLYNMIAAQMGWKQISEGAVAVWRDKCDDLICARRHGQEYYRANREMQVKRSMPTRPLLFCTMDGWDIELMYQKKPERGATTYFNRLTMVVVLDACTKYPLGFSIGENESPALIKEALRDAMRETEHLFGKMYCFDQLQSDHFGMKTLNPTYQVVADKVTPARVKNAKAKIIEPWFGYFNKKYCQMQTNWSGFGITSRKELQPNVEFINKYKKDFPDFAGVCRQVVSFIMAERKELREAYVSQFSSEGLREMSREQYLYTFGIESKSRYLLQGSGIRATIGGRKMDYDCFDTHFRKYASVRWALRYDPDDMHYALAVNEDGTLQYVLEEKYIQPMALADRSEGDYEQLQRVMDFNRRKESEMADDLSAKNERARDILEQTTLSKLLITDSNGQHKLPKAKARLAAAQLEEVADDDNFYDMY